MKYRTAPVSLLIFLSITLGWMISGFLVSAQTTDSSQNIILQTPKLNVDIPGLQFASGIIAKQGEKTEIPFLAQYIAAIANYLFGIVVITSAVMIVWGGFKYILSANFSEIKNGKEIIKDALIGLFLALGIITILQTVNPATSLLTSLKIQVITQDPYLANFSKLTANDTDSVSATSGKTVDSGKNKGCVGTPKYSVKSGACNSIEDCYDKFCSGKAMKTGIEAPSGYFSRADLWGNKNGLKNFSEFPEKKAEQIEQYGLYVGESKLERNGKGLLAEAYAGLLKAGETAKSKGYYIAVADTTRTWDDQIVALCQRYDPVSKVASGLSIPGASPHQVGIAIDASLFQIERDANGALVFDKSIIPKNLKAGFPPLCMCQSPERPCEKNINFVDTQILRGAQYLRTFEEIMTSGGFYHYCQEGWHFDYGGVYAKLDCNECAFPPEPARGDFICKINHLDKLPK